MFIVIITVLSQITRIDDSLIVFIVISSKLLFLFQKIRYDSNRTELQTITVSDL